MRSLIASCVVVACVVVGSNALASPGQDLERGRKAFVAKDWQSAFPILNSLVNPVERLAQSQDLVETYVLLGATHVEMGNIDDAKREFEKALKLQSDRELGELTFSENARKVFAETRRAIAERDKRLADALAIQKQLDDIAAYKKSAIVFENRPWSRNFLPFGAGQFQNKDRVKGVLFSVGQGITLGTSVGIWLYLVNTYGLTSSQVPLDKASSVFRLQAIEVGTGAAFIVLYGWSVIDALLHYKPIVRTQFDDSLLPENLRLKPAAKPKKTSLRDRLHFGPMITPGGVGIGLGWEN